MLVFPNCKINIGLYITDRRTDGYHNLETVFYPVRGLTDALETVPAADGRTSLHISGRAVAGDSTQNLVWKAWQLLAARFPDQVTGAAIYLHKAIPMGAGMGGGSADGAFALQLLRDLFRLPMTDEDLAPLALELGSDCPFFLRNTPQYATGRGERMTPVALDLSGYSLQLICPEVHVSTAAAFRMITPRPAPFDLRALPGLPAGEWKEHISNDFEEPVFAQHPELRDIRDRLYAAGALYAAMTGSGSTVYGIFEKGMKAAGFGPGSFYFE